jgi:hypothetical protein
LEFGLEIEEFEESRNDKRQGCSSDNNFAYGGEDERHKELSEENVKIVQHRRRSCVLATFESYQHFEFSIYGRVFRGTRSRISLEQGSKFAMRIRTIAKNSLRFAQNGLDFASLSLRNF